MHNPSYVQTIFMCVRRIHFSGLHRPRKGKKGAKASKASCAHYSFSLKEGLLRHPPSRCLEPWEHSRCTECPEPHGLQSGVLAFSKTHRWHYYGPNVELFQLAKLKLNWYLQYVDGDPYSSTGFRSDVGHSGRDVQGLLLLTTGQVYVFHLNGLVHTAHLSFLAQSVKAAPHIVCLDLKREDCLGPCSLEVHCLLFSRS